MTVAFDAQGTSFTDGGSSPVSFAKLTVGSGSNRALIVQIVTLGSIAGVTVTWGFGGTAQACTLIGAPTDSSSTARALLYGLVAPTSGAKTLRVAWTGAVPIVVDAVSYSGVDQTGGTTSFANFNSATGTSTSASVTVTSATGDAVVACGGKAVSGGTDTGNNTVVFTDTDVATFGACAGWGNRAAGAATVAMTTTLSGSAAWVQIGCDVVAAASGASAVFSDSGGSCDLSLLARSGNERQRTVWWS